MSWPALDLRCLEVEWDAPLDDAGSPVTRYRISFDSKSNNFESVVQDIDLAAGSEIPRTVKSTSLAEGGIYYVKVRAANSKGGEEGYGRPAYGNAVRVVSMPGTQYLLYWHKSTHTEL